MRTGDSPAVSVARNTPCRLATTMGSRNVSPPSPDAMTRGPPPEATPAPSVARNAAIMAPWVECLGTEQLRSVGFRAGACWFQPYRSCTPYANRSSPRPVTASGCAVACSAACGRPVPARRGDERMWKAEQKCAEPDRLVRMSMEMSAGPTPDTLGPLLNVLAQSLDVREVFAQVSALARQTIPHDGLMFGLITADGEHYRIIASSEVALSEEDSRVVLRESPLSALSRRLLQEDFAIAHHIQDLPGKAWGCTGQLRTASSAVDEPFEWHPNVPWARGYDSWMRLTVRLRGGVLGFLNVLSHAPEQYTEADVPAARRIADLVALAFAHEHLAEEERRRAEAQERAVQLEGRVARLTA